MEILSYMKTKTRRLFLRLLNISAKCHFQNRSL